MNTKLKQYLIISAYILIPILAILVCRGLRVAQGEKNEEIIIGIMAGNFLNVIYVVVLTVLAKFKR